MQKITLLLLTVSAAIFHFVPVFALIYLDFDIGVDYWEYITSLFFALLLVYLGIQITAGKRKQKNKGNWHEKVSRLYEFSKGVLYGTSLIIMPLALHDAYNLFIVGYGKIDPVGQYTNFLMYIQLTLLPLVLAADIQSRRERILMLSLIIIPRLLISVVGPRFFLLQAIIPIIIFYIYKHRLSMISPKIIMIGGVAFFYLFYLNPLIRGDDEKILEHIAIGSPINLLPLTDSLGLDIELRDNMFIICGLMPVLSEMIVCPQNKNGIVGEALRYDFMLTKRIRGDTSNEYIGTGGNPLLETGVYYGNFYGYIWFLLTGVVVGVVIGNMFRNIYALILYPHVVTKVIFLWRGTVVEFFDRIPLIIITTCLLLFAVKLIISAQEKTKKIINSEML